MEKKLRSRLKIQLIIFILLFFTIEIILRLFGMHAGTLIDDFKVQDNPVYQPRFYSDSEGINHIINDPATFMKGTVINREGFRGLFDYAPERIDSIRKKTQKKIVMIIGDSYVEGCCPDSVTNSFPDIINRDSHYSVLNFGVAGTDPLQYKLVAKRYVKELKPDVVVIAFYFGNDIFNFERVPSPGTPLTFPFKDNKWLYAIAPNHLSGELNHVFKNDKEAYRFYLDHYTLTGTHRNGFEKLISHSVIFSKIYLAVEHKIAKYKWEKKNPTLHIDTAVIPYNQLQEIKTICDKAGIPSLFVGIPAPEEAKMGKKLKEKYSWIFKSIPWYVPENLTTRDYDGTTIGNHFNNEGHKKYASFLKALLNEKQEINK